MHCKSGNTWAILTETEGLIHKPASQKHSEATVSHLQMKKKTTANSMLEIKFKSDFIIFWLTCKMDTQINTSGLEQSFISTEIVFPGASMPQCIQKKKKAPVWTTSRRNVALSDCWQLQLSDLETDSGSVHDSWC